MLYISNLCASLLFCGATFTLPAAWTQSGEKPIDALVTGVYSDMCYHEEAGDLLGIEVHVLYSEDGYYVLFQSSEGAPAAPVLVPANFSDSTIIFAIPKGVSYEGQFKGTIVGDTLFGSISGYTGYASKLQLIRQLSYWQRTGDQLPCK